MSIARICAASRPRRLKYRRSTLGKGPGDPHVCFLRASTMPSKQEMQVPGHHELLCHPQALMPSQYRPTNRRFQSPQFFSRSCEGRSNHFLQFFQAKRLGGRLRYILAERDDGVFDRSPCDSGSRLEFPSPDIYVRGGAIDGADNGYFHSPLLEIELVDTECINPYCPFL